MTRVQWALLILGVLGLAESVWGMTAPSKVKALAAWFTSPRPRGLGLLLGAVAALLVVLVLIGQPLAHWALLAVATLFAWVATLCFRPDGFRHLLQVWLVNRADLSVRLIYAAEFAVAMLLLWLALAKAQVP